MVSGYDPCLYIVSQCQSSICQRNRFRLTGSCLRYLFSSAPWCEGCALSPGAPAQPGSQLLPINDSRALTHRWTEGTLKSTTRDHPKFPAHKVERNTSCICTEPNRKKQTKKNPIWCFKILQGQRNRFIFWNLDKRITKKCMHMWTQQAEWEAKH